MKTTLIAIGNSRGIRIPKPFIEQCGLEKFVEIEVRDSVIHIRAPRQTRAGWSEAFMQMAQERDDKLVDDLPTSNRWDDEEWEWK